MKVSTMISAASAAVFTAASAMAAEYAVSDLRKIVMTTGDSLRPATTGVSATLPAVATPIFHLDAQTRTGWTFDAVDSAAVTEIPSLVGSRRLTTVKTGGSWSRTDWPIAPTLIEADASLGGLPSIDFGAVGSKKGFLFNAISDASTGNIASNTLDGIGTVFVVVNSENGGGGLMGGGYGRNNSGINTGNLWYRGLSAWLSGNWNANDPWSPLVRYYGGAVNDVGSVKLALGVAWHDGAPTSPQRVGMSGGWEVISISPTEASLTATGYSLGALGRSNNLATGADSGGMRLAEMVVYGEILSDADRALVEAYLEKKWFGRDMRGYGSSAVADFVRASKNEYTYYMTNGAVVEASVAAGETLKIGRLVGGRGRYGSFNIKGAGTVEIGDASSYQGTVRLHGGTLRLSKRAIPESLPSGAILHFDASDEDSLHWYEDENGLQKVNLWDSQSDFTFDGHRLCLAPNAQYAPERLPWIRRNAMPGGRPVLDFGTGFTSGAHLLVARADATTTNIKLPCISTVIVVLSPHSGAISLVGPFDGKDPAGADARSYFNPSAYNRGWTSPIFSSSALTAINPTLNGAAHNKTFIDGIRHDHSTGYPHPGWQVAAFQSPGSQIGAVGSTANHYYAGGACCLAEIVMYARPLSEREILDAQAYLSEKWFSRETPGYARTAERARVDDIAVLDIAGSATLEVAGGTTVRVGTLNCGSTLRKTGAGVLEVGKVVNGACNLVVEDGRIVAAAASEPADNCSPAKDPAARFDASDESSFIFNTSDTSRDYVWMWYDTTGRNCAYWQNSTQSANQPWLNRTDVLNGMPVVDFGAAKSYKYLKFARPLDGVKAAFVVWGSQNGGGCLLGNVDVHGFANGNMNDFFRAQNATIDNPIFAEDNRSQHVWGGSIYTNGVAATYRAKPSGGWDMVEVYPSGSTHVSAFAFQRNGDNTGGQRLAEVILYERELTDAEKVATRNYLMKKWFNAEEQPAPAAASADVDYGVFAVDGENTVDVASASTAAVLSGAGTVEKTGAGTLFVENIDAFTGTVSVAEGGLSLTGRAASGVEPRMATDGLILQMDAGYGVTVVEDTMGRESVAEWAAKTGGVKAIPDSHGINPVYWANALNGLPAVGMLENTYYRWQYMRFVDANGDFTRVGGIRSAFWVVGSQEGGGHLLGGGTNANNDVQHYNFHRGGANAGAAASDPLLSGAAQSQVQAASWRLNGKSITATQKGLSGGWDVVSMALRPDAALATECEGFAFDGRFNPYNGAYSYADRSGRQRLAEVLLYDRVLSEGEIAATEAYLAEKWNVHRPAASESNGLSVELGQGTVLSMGEQSRLAGLSGCGSVGGSVAADSLVADFASAGALSVGGTFTVPAGVHVDVRNLPADEARVKILEAIAIAGAENAGTAVFTGQSPGARVLRLYVSGTSLYCRVSLPGFRILLR